MKNDTVHVAFQNSQNPRAAFDILRIEELFSRENVAHPIDQLHLVKFYMLIVITSGSGQHTIDFTTYDYSPGSMITIRQGQIHRFHKNPTVSGFLLLFTDDFLVSYLEAQEATRTLQVFNEVLLSPLTLLPEVERQNTQDQLSRILHEYMTINDPYSLGIIRSELHILITKLYRHRSLSTQRLSTKYLKEFIRLQALIESNVQTINRVSEYARMMAVSTKTLSNITHEIIHLSAKEFIDGIRVKQIKRLLINTEDSVKEIAYLSGFDDVPNFHKYFKRHTALTPEEFRSRHH